jgi:hypothetical protein
MNGVHRIVCSAIAVEANELASSERSLPMDGVANKAGTRYYCITVDLK